MVAAKFDVDATLTKLPIGDKIKLLAGTGWWHSTAVPGVPAIRMSDGPNGVRGTHFFNGVPSSCFPSSTGLGSSFDIELAAKVGKALGEESRAKGAHVLLAPTVNTQRSPLGGRSFESFSEDPHLNGTIAGAYINGIQSTGVSATIKHFVANDQEFERFSVSSEVDQRTLREIYLKPFQIAIRDSNPWALMTAYNRINGLHCSEDKWLLDNLLRKEWGYKGTLISDWIGVYSTAESIKAGLDIEMPGPPVMRGAAVARALISGKLFPQDIDARARKVLELIEKAHASGIPFDGPENLLDTPEVRATLRTASADAIVLLKNDKSVLPLSPETKSIALIGPNAKYAVISGGGSASLRPTYVVSPLEGITNAAKEIGATIEYAVGAHTHKFLPLIDPLIRHDGQPGALLEFWNEPPTKSFLDTQPDFSDKLPQAAWSTGTQSSTCFLADGVDESKVNEVCWLRYSTTFVPDEDGDWEIGLNIAGQGNLFIDEKLVIELSNNPPQGEAFFGLGTIDKRAILSGLKAGQEYKIDIRLGNADFVARGSPFTCRGGIRLGAVRQIEEDEGIHVAVELAKKSNVAILVIGLNHDWESEGFDREDIKLPGATNRLVTEVLKANPKTIIVNQCGSPVEMPWAEEAHTLLQAFYGGNEVGNGIADIIFGKVNPSAKLSLTFPKRLEDSPSYPSFGNKTQRAGTVLYNEGVFVGYRGFEIKHLAPLFPFGYGLTYTTFEYSELKVTPIDSEGAFSISFNVKNTGKVDGREVAQVYIADPVSTLPRPIKELKGFTKVALKAGESKAVTVELDRHALSFYDQRRSAWVAEAGTFEVLVAASSVDVKLTAEAELAEDIVWTGL